MNATANEYTVKTMYTMRDAHGESQEVVVCGHHAKEMPAVDGERIEARSVDSECDCEFCGPAPKIGQPCDQCGTALEDMGAFGIGCPKCAEDEEHNRGMGDDSDVPMICVDAAALSGLEPGASVAQEYAAKKAECLAAIDAIRRDIETHAPSTGLDDSHLADMKRYSAALRGVARDLEGSQPSDRFAC